MKATYKPPTNPAKSGSDKYYSKINADLSYCRNRIQEIFTTARVNHYTLSAIIANRGFVMDTKQFKRLPQVYRAEILGGFTSLFNYFMLTELVWVHWYNGEYIGNKNENRDEVNRMYARPDFHNGNITSEHVYRGTKIIFDPKTPTA